MSSKYVLLLFLLCPFLMPHHADALRLWSSGCEFESDSVNGNMTDGMEFDNIFGSPQGSLKVATTTFRSGLSSCEVVGTTTHNVPQFNHQFASIATSSAIYVRMYLNIKTLPATSTDIMVLWDQGIDGSEGTVMLKRDGTLAYYNDENQMDTGGTTVLATNRWYRVELKYVNTTEATILLDGNTEVSAGSHTGDDVDSVFFGQCSAIACTSSEPYEIYFDDFAVNSSGGTVQNTYPGVGSIVHMQPDSAGDSNGCSAGDSTSVDEVTPDDATTKCILDNDAGGDVIDVNVETSTAAGIDSFDTITLVQAGIRQAAASVASETWNTRIKSAAGGTTSSGISVAHTTTAYTTNGGAVPKNYTLTAYTDPTTGTAWTPTGTNSLDNMQIGANAVDGNPDINVTTLWALVEYVDGVAPSTSNSGKSVRIDGGASMRVQGGASLIIQ